MLVCARCGQENPDGFRFCGACGAELVAASAPAPAREERKVVTVLFCDLVGFTSRAELLDPEDVRAVLNPYHERVKEELERFGGTVEKFIGDAVVAVFGAPAAHEDDPERAVRAALLIRDWAREVGAAEVRIGVNTGEAVVALDARPERGEGMVAGDVVNTAARLQGAAPRNGILVGETTYRATRDSIDYGTPDTVDAKGKAEPVRVWEALEARSRLGVDLPRRGRAPLVGRAAEVGLVLDVFERTRRERATQLVTLVGAPGIGKSRLVAELFRRVEEDPELVTWRQGRSLPYGEGISFWALGEIVKAQAGILEGDAPATAERKLAAALETALGESMDADWIATHIRPLVGLGGDAEAGTDRRSESFAAWRRFVEAVAETGPTVLVFEDLHWADDLLLDFVDHLADWTEGAALLLVCTARPELLDRRPGWGGGKRNATTVSLSPLTDEDTARLVARLLDRAVLPAELQTALLQRAGGNPLYAEEYARMIAEGAEVSSLPETVQGIIAARLDALTPEDKSLLQDGAVLGKVFWLSALAALTGMSRPELEERLHALGRRELIRRERRSSVADDTEFAFLHVLLRDVAYGQIPRAARAEKHRRAAEWIGSLGRTEDTAEMLAHHYLSALEYTRASGGDAAALEPRTARALREAGDRASSLSAFPAALRHYRQALALVGAADPARPGLLVAYARALFHADEEGAAELLAEARVELLRLGEREGAGEVSAMLANREWHGGRGERAFELVREGLELLEDVPSSRSKAAALAELARLLALDEQRDEAVEVAQGALAMAEEIGALDLQARALNTLGIARVSIDDVERSVELATEANAPDDIVRGLSNLFALSHYSGDVARADRLHRRGLEAAARFGNEAGRRWLVLSRPELDYHLGRWDELVTNADELLREIEAGRSHYQEGATRLPRALVRLARGDREGALADAERSLEVARAIGDPQTLNPTLAVVAHVYAAAERRAEAAELADELLALSSEVVTAATVPWADLAAALAALGRGGQVVELAAKKGTEAGTPRWLEAARLYGAGDFVRAADEYARIGSLPYEADARLRAARKLVQSGRRAEADVQLNRALAFYRSVGAKRYVREGEALLAATG